MQLDFQVDFSGWVNAMRDANSRASDLTPAHELIGDYLVSEMRGNMTSRGGAARWKDLQPSTLQRNPRPGDAPLIVTRDLINSIRKSVNAAYVDVGSSIAYARAQWFGTSRIPARTAFSWLPGVMDQVGRIYLQFIFTGARRLWPSTSR